MDSSWHFLFLLLLVILLSFFSFSKSTTTNPESYSVANRNVGIFALTATLVMTEFNTATLISFSSLGYLSGVKALMLPGVFLIGLAFYAVSVAKKWKSYNGVSVVDFFISRFNRKIGTIAAIFLFTSMAGFSATYLKSLTLLFTNILPEVSYWVVSAYITLFTLIMVIRKGLISIIKIDTFAFLIVLFAMPLILYKTSGHNGFYELEISTPIFKDDILKNNFIFSLIPLTMFSYILAPWYGQRIFAAKNARVAYISVMLSAVFVFVLYALGVLISYYVASQGIKLSDPQLSFPYALEHSLPKILYPLGYLFLFLISSTTLTGVWNAMTNISLEFVSFENVRNQSIIMTLICAFLTYLLSNLLVDNILNKMILANIPVVSLSFALLAGFYWKKVSIAGVYTSITIGILAGVSTYIILGDEGCYTWYWAFMGIPLMFIGGIVMSLLFPQKTKSYQLLKVQASNLSSRSM